MQLGRYQVSTLRPPPVLSIDFSTDGRFFGVATEHGYEIWKSWPLGLLRRRRLPGTLAKALPLPHSPLLALQGGGNSPLYPPNKVVVFHDALGQAVAELEFGERVRSITARRGSLYIALSRRVLAYDYGMASPTTDSLDTKGKGKAKQEGFWIRKVGEWETALNENGIMAISTMPGSTLLALPGRQPGHVQLIHLPPCPPSSPSHAVPTTTFRSPIILAHTHHLSALSCSADGAYIITASERGTLLRVWDTARGRLQRELRRGVDRAEMWGAALEEGVAWAGHGTVPEKTDREGAGEGGVTMPFGRVVGWSDKGTVHVWASGGAPAQQVKAQPPIPTAISNLLTKNLPLPKYFSSSPSTSLYHLPRKNPHAFASTIGAAAEKARMPSMKMSAAAAAAAAGEEGEWSERFVVGWVEVEVEVEVAVESKMDVDVIGEGRRKRDEVGTNMGMGTGTGSGPGLNMGMGTTMGAGLTMGTREERRSFGSDRTTVLGTSRTPTPTYHNSRLLPSQGGLAPVSRSRPRVQERTMSGSSKDTSRLAKRGTGGASITGTVFPGINGSSPFGNDRPAGTRFSAVDANHPNSRSGNGATKRKEIRKERQLIAVTYGGDWYRLRIPKTDPDSSVGPAVNTEKDGRYQDISAKEDEEEVKKRRLELVEYRRLNIGGGGW